ncbi:hypothetical protein, partial [Bifidobacterium jacchi]
MRGIGEHLDGGDEAINTNPEVEQETVDAKEMSDRQRERRNDLPNGDDVSFDDEAENVLGDGDEGEYSGVMDASDGDDGSFSDSVENDFDGGNVDGDGSLEHTGGLGDGDTDEDGKRFDFLDYDDEHDAGKSKDGDLPIATDQRGVSDENRDSAKSDRRHSATDDKRDADDDSDDVDNTDDENVQEFNTDSTCEANKILELESSERNDELDENAYTSSGEGKSDGDDEADIPSEDDSRYDKKRVFASLCGGVGVGVWVWR